MLDLISKIVTNVLTAFYQPFWFSVLFTVSLMFVYLYAREQGWKLILKKWLSVFKTSASFRKLFFLTFFIVLILFRTLLNRNLWANPLSDVIGPWGIHNDNGTLTTETIENFLMFVPFTLLLFWNFSVKLTGKPHSVWKIVWVSVKYSFLFSLGIEFLQLLLRLGTFQLSDLFYNTMGGLFGGLLYWLGVRIMSSLKKRFNGEEKI